jgi:hypothetical protein
MRSSKFSQGSGAFAVSTKQYLAQPFVLNVSANVSSITFTFGSASPNSQFVVELTNASGSGATSANVLAQATLTFSGPFHQLLTLPVGFSLARGTYYIAASTTADRHNWSHKTPPGPQTYLGFHHPL